MVGGGIAALSAAVLLVRDGGVPGDRITILEHQGAAGGSLDHSGDAGTGYLTRGGRMFEPNFVCTLDVLATIPAPDNPAVSVRDDILAFNRMVAGRGECRIVRNGRKAEDRYRLGLGPEEIVALSRLLLTPEGRLDGRSIEDWFAPAFFGTNFWIMWSTMFSFQPWHSVAEMRRYMRRFLHLFPGLARIEGILRTRYNQYDSIVGPILAWLAGHGVDLRTGSTVADVTIAGDADERRVTQLHLAVGDVIDVAPEDRVYPTLGSMTDATSPATRIRRRPQGMARRPDSACGGGWPPATRGWEGPRSSLAIRPGPPGPRSPSRWPRRSSSPSWRISAATGPGRVDS